MDKQNPIEKMTPSFIAFGKDYNLVEYADIENYFATEQFETDSLEFKSFSGNALDQERTIFKEICAMLNSDGGLIIWGAPRERSIPDRKEKAAQGELLPIPFDQRIERGRFYNRMGGEITPLPSAVRFRELEKNGEFVYLIEVDKSIYSPHQYDKEYYPMRMGASVRAAPHHYVEALFKKAVTGNLSGKIRFDRILPLENSGGTSTDIQLLLFVIIENQAPHLNEENLYFSLHHPCGKYQRYDTRNKEGVKLNSDSFSQHHAVPVLFFGEPFEAKIWLNFPDYNLYQDQLITLSFGGKSSPLKKTIYRIRAEGNPAALYLLDTAIAENVPIDAII